MPFSVEDIHDLVPVVKHSPPEMPELQDLVETARIQSTIGSIDISFELIQESISLLHQICNGAHPLTATCYSTMAIILANVGDFTAAAQNEQRALSLNQHLHGPDHYETIRSHMILSMCYKQAGRADLGVAHMRRALYLMEVVSGVSASEIATGYLRLGDLYMEMHHIPLTVQSINESMKRNPTDAFHFAQCQQSLALANALKMDFRRAVDHQRRAQKVFRELLGADHYKAKESTLWLEKFISAAIQKERGTSTVGIEVIQEDTTQTTLTETKTEEKSTVDSKKKKKRGK